jgi:hypothetical protein
MSPDRDNIEYQLDRMKIGQRLDVPAREFQRAYPCGWPTIYDTPEQAFLSSRIGSAWGAWTVHRHESGGHYTISRYEEGKRRVYVDPDRAHLFHKGSDGTLRRK